MVFAEADAVSLVADVLKASDDAGARALAAELTHLLTTNNPANRAALGKAGVLR